jgi:hypothetical protein
MVDDVRVGINRGRRAPEARSLLDCWQKIARNGHDVIGDFALGTDLFAKRMAYNEMVDIPPDKLLDIAYSILVSRKTDTFRPHALRRR